MTSKFLTTIREDDFIEYFLFPKFNESNDEIEKEINNLVNEINSIIENYTKNYIWHKDNFNLKPRLQNSNLLLETNDDEISESLPPHLYGISHYGDNIQDEWFIVSILYKISLQYPNIVIRVIDSDGEFLLIESAEFLPEWANPNTCEQRVYIYNGQLHLVFDSSENTNNLLPVSSAIEKLHGNPTIYRVTTEIENSIFQRIKEYPENIENGLHKTTVYVPLGVAALLKHKPSLISAACRAFCNRDVIDMKACKAMRYFPPENRVYTVVTFSKCLYAMLMHKTFTPDRRTGWNQPHSSHANYKSHSLGVKIASGFEILASQSKPFKNIDEDKGWFNYLESLNKKNYFQNNLEGSKDYNRLLEVAKEYYIENRDSMYYAPKIGQEILSLLQNLEYTNDDFSNETIVEDDDSWMNISPEELDKMLTDRYGVKKLFTIQNGNIDSNSDNLTEHLSDFLNRRSEYDGIEIGEIESPVRPQRGIKRNSINNINNNKQNSSSSEQNLTHDDQIDSNKVEFDADGFQAHVKNLVDLIIPEDNWDSNSEMSDYEDDDDIEKNISSIPSTNINIKKYMDQMDLELSKTTIGKSFEKKSKNGEFDDIENFTPVDIDKNTLKNMVASYQSQLGGPGPVSNLLTSMGIGIKAESDIVVDDNNEGTTV